MSSRSASSFAKFFLILLNVVFMLAGAALALVGIYLLFVDNIFHIVYVDNYIDADENVVSKYTGSGGSRGLAKVPLRIWFGLFI